jgi:hypothetical protein
MSNIFTLENIEGFSEKINIDELYEKKRQYDLNKLELFNKLLNRVHVKIKTTSRQKIDEQFCWFVVPETMIGIPKYDQAGCIAYLMEKLKDNGFAVRYIHPNALFICWTHWVPSYVRNELKKKTGIVVNEYGTRVDQMQQLENVSNEAVADPNDFMFTKPTPLQKESKPISQKKFTPVQSYKPSGNLVYNDDILNKLEDKFN